MGLQEENVRVLHERLSSSVERKTLSPKAAKRVVNRFRNRYLSELESALPNTIEALATLELELGDPNIAEALLEHPVYRRNQFLLEVYTNAVVYGPQELTDFGENLVYQAVDLSLIHSSTMHPSVLSELDSRAEVELALLRAASVDNDAVIRVNRLTWGTQRGLFTLNDIVSAQGSCYSIIARRALSYLRQGDECDNTLLRQLSFEGYVSQQQIAAARLDGARTRLKEFKEDIAVALYIMNKKC